MDYTGGTENLLRLLLAEKYLSPDLREATNEQHSNDDIRTLVQCVLDALSVGFFRMIPFTFL